MCEDLLAHYVLTAKLNTPAQYEATGSLDWTAVAGRPLPGPARSRPAPRPRRPRNTRRAGGQPAALTLTEKTLITTMRQRLKVPRADLADLLGVSANTIGTAERQVKPLLARVGHTIEAATNPLTLADLTAYATSQGITLTPKTKPAR
ncbi:MAG: hypothetical protein M3Y33_00750 [Actinomycetota bacterium]|nr:hypothetical protein [Actinomycetota bacterium]